MLKRRHYIVSGAVLVLALIVLNLPRQAASQVKLAVSSLFLPLFGLAGAAHGIAGDAGDSIEPRPDLLRKIAQLEAENRKLTLDSAQLQNAAAENEKLRELLKFQKPAPWYVRSARVLGTDPSNFWRTIRIDLGEREGLVANCPVLSKDLALVGRVSEVHYTWSQVVPLTDVNCKAPAIIQETSLTGVVGALSHNPLNYSFVRMNYLRSAESLKKGQTVRTSGQGTIFPKGILIGYIEDSRRVDGLDTEARVRLAADLNALEYVQVILP